MTDYLVPGILLAASLAVLRKNENGYAVLLEGGAQGLRLLAGILPALIVLLSAYGMLKASGGLALLTKLCTPLLSALGIPPECAALMLLRPISGSAALAVGAELMGRFGVDSPIGRTAAVMLGSTETTFYVLSVYFGAAGITRTRYALPAALLADLAGFLASAFAVRIFF